MANFNYLYTNVFGAIKTTGSGCFSPVRDERGKYTNLVIGNLDIKYKLNNEVVYKFINLKSPLYLGKEVKLNEDIFFGSYASLRNSNGRTNNANIAYRFVCNNDDINFNPALLINNSHFIKNIYDNQITNNSWYDLINSSDSIEDKINDVNHNFEFGDLTIDALVDLKNTYLSNYKNIVLQALDELVLNNFKKRVVIQGNPIDNARIIQMILLLLPLDIARKLSYNTFAKDMLSLMEVNIAGVSSNVNIQDVDNMIIIDGGKKLNIKSYFVKKLSLSSELFKDSVLDTSFNVNEECYNISLDSLLVDDYDFKEGFKFIEYCFINYEVSMLVDNQKVFNIVDELLLNVDYLIKLDCDKLVSYIINAKYEEDNILKNYCIKFINNLNSTIFSLTEKVKINYLIKLFKLITENEKVINLLTKENLESFVNDFTNGIITFFDEGLDAPLYEYLYLGIDLIIKYNNEDDSFAINCLEVLFNNFESEVSIKAIELLFNNRLDAKYSYTLIKGLVLSGVEIYFDMDVSNNKMKIYNYLKEIIYNPSNVDFNAKLYSEIKKIDSSIDLSWLENNLISAIETLEEVFNMNKSFNDDQMLHQVHKKTSAFFVKNLELINYDNYKDIKIIYDKYENDNVSDFYEIEDIVLQRLNLIGNEILVINKSKVILASEFNQKRSYFINKQRQLFGDVEVTEEVFNQSDNKNSNDVLTKGSSKPKDIKKQPSSKVAKTKQVNKNEANSKDNNKVLICSCLLFVGTLLLLIPIYIFARKIINYCLIFGIISICVSLRELSRFKNESYKKKIKYVVLNNLFIVYLPLVLLIAAVMIMMFVL